MSPPASRSDAIQLSVDGPFDLSTARRVARALTDADAGTLVRIDLTRVSHFDDSGVAVLGQALAGHRRADIRGLRRHQVRLLHYLGFHGIGESIIDSQAAWSS
jgi:ABC-type transporter Mla MlaB component